jgi:hypothetical protein
MKPYCNQKRTVLKQVFRFLPAGLLILLLAGNSVFSPVHAQARPAGKPAPFTAYLFVYFTGNSKAEEQIRYAISRDGYHFTALNNNQP